MVMGGTEKALLSFIKNIDKNNYEITLLLSEKGGELFDQIPKDIKVTTLDNLKDTINLLDHNSPIQIIRKLSKKHKWKDSLLFLLYYLIAKFFNRWDFLIRFKVRKLEIKENYDIAIAYAGPSPLVSFICLEKIKSKLKVQWIHSDINHTFNDLGFGKRYYKKFNQIICVSKAALKSFKEKYPECKNVKVLYNVIDYEAIYKLSKIGETFAKDIEGLKILTVGRLSLEKGIDLIPEIANILKEKDIKFCWYIVGDGELRGLLESKIVEYHLEKNLLLIGNKNNPYPYFKDCDMYVQPSRHEGYGISVAEAKFFDKKIILTNFASAQELANNYPNIEITNFSPEDIAKKIINNIKNKDVLND